VWKSSTEAYRNEDRHSSLDVASGGLAGGSAERRLSSSADACEKPGFAACRRFPEHKWQAARELSVLPALLRFQWARASISAGIERKRVDARKRASHGHLADQAGTAFYVSICAGISSAGHVHGWNLVGR